MPIVRSIGSPVLEPKNTRARSLSKLVRSYHVNQPIQARIMDPKDVRKRLVIFERRLGTDLIALEGCAEAFSACL